MTKIIENTGIAKDKFGHNYGSETLKLTSKMMKALKSGKCIAREINGGEYTLFIVPEKI